MLSGFAESSISHRRINDPPPYGHTHLASLARYPRFLPMLPVTAFRCRFLFLWDIARIPKEGSYGRGWGARAGEAVAGWGLVYAGLVASGGTYLLTQGSVIRLIGLREGVGRARRGREGLRGVQGPGNCKIPKSL